MIKNFKLKIKNYDGGQVAIVVLLVSAIMLTMGLSMSKQTTIETKIDTNEELLKKAFNAAESGISYYLGTGEVKYASPDNLSQAEISVSEISQNSDVINFDEYVAQGDFEFYWLVDHLANGTIGSNYYDGDTVEVCQEGFTGALRIDYFYLSGINYQVRRFGYNFGSDAAFQVDNFTSAVGSDCVTVPTPDNPLLLVVSPITGGGRFYVEGEVGATFSSQGLDISSVGRAGGAEAEATEAQVNKTVTVRRRYKIPSFLLSAISSEGSILSD